MKKNWRSVRFGDVVKLNKDRVADPQVEGIERFVGIEHIEPEDLRIRSWGLVAEGTTFTNYFQPGQVLFVKRRAYQRKVAVADFSGVCSGDIYVLESKDPKVLLPELLPFICQTESFYEHAVETSAGSLSPRTNWKRLANFEFALPPLEEQRRIAEMLLSQESLFEDFSFARQALNGVKNSILKDVFGGYSTPNVSWQNLNDFCIRIGDGTHQPPKFTDSGIPFLLVSNIASGELNNEISKWISLKSFRELTKTFQPGRGDVLYSLVGSYGVPVFVDWDWEFSFQRHIGFIRTKEDVLRGKYLYFFLQSLSAKRQADRLAEGLAQKTITLRSLRSFRLPIPETDVQDDIVIEIEHIDQSQQDLRRRQDQLSEIKTQVLSSLLEGKTF